MFSLEDLFGDIQEACPSWVLGTLDGFEAFLACSWALHLSCEALPEIVALVAIIGSLQLSCGDSPNLVRVW